MMRVANLATKFVKKEDNNISSSNTETKEDYYYYNVACAACGRRVFAAEAVAADGLHVHRACFRCAVCRAVLRPGNYKTERYGSRLVCPRHWGCSALDAAGPAPRPAQAPATASAAVSAPAPALLPATPERISVELSDAREIDEDEWTDRNFLASETSAPTGLSSDEEESSTEEYIDADESEDEAARFPEPAMDAHHMPHSRLYCSDADDSFPYDEYSDDGAESSGAESWSRMEEAREARRREVPRAPPAPAHPDTSEMETEESESSDDEVSSATEVSTDSEFAREESAPVPSPPAILVTEAPAPIPSAPPPPAAPAYDYPLSRTKSAGGLATKRALELKRKYLLGEPSPPAVRKSESTSQLDTKLEAFRFNITEFQKMLHPATQPVHKPYVSFQLTDPTGPPQTTPDIPDIIKNVCSDAPVDLLTKGDSPLCKQNWNESSHDAVKYDLETDSLSEESHTETAPKSVPRVEVHDEVGDLVQLDSLILVSEEIDRPQYTGETISGNVWETNVANETDNSESCKDATTLALTENEFSDWAAEGVVVDDCSIDDKEDRSRNKTPRSLSGPKLIHDAKNISAIASHVCGRSGSPDLVGYSNAIEHLEFADEVEHDHFISAPVPLRNEGYMELVDDGYEPYAASKDRSMNFIERAYAETAVKPAGQTEAPAQFTDMSDNLQYIDGSDSKSESILNDNVNTNPNFASDSKSHTAVADNVASPPNEILSNASTGFRRTDTGEVETANNLEEKLLSISLSELSPPLDMTDRDCLKASLANEKKSIDDDRDDISPPLACETTDRHATHINLRSYSPAICRSASETFKHSAAGTSMNKNWMLSIKLNPEPDNVTMEKVQELKRERDEQTEVVRWLVLERLGAARGRVRVRSRARLPPGPATPPPVPPPPALAPPPPPTPPTPPPALMRLPPSASLSDPELMRERWPKSFVRSISNYLNKRLSPRHKYASEPALTMHVSKHVTYSINEQGGRERRHTSAGSLERAPPPVPPPPAGYCPPAAASVSPRHAASYAGNGAERSNRGDADERDAMQLWFEARWARLVAQRRARDEARDEPAARRLARSECQQGPYHKNVYIDL
ncbi:uncharacterized protein LOC126978884 [Leptidea sinapis]|uniref:uncharacterized protein LOC126978884 n=1 Tax=Leptidea sinapis TaxID=189913 RepID=UPI0021C38E08|nr:uncharacterized protein LOC126978884 [Leptidea sinapis]